MQLVVSEQRLDERMLRAESLREFLQFGLVSRDVLQVVVFG